MKLRNPGRRAVRLEVVSPFGPPMVLRIGAGATIDLARYESALEALATQARAEERKSW
jgi:hypothetical protein